MDEDGRAVDDGAEPEEPVSSSDGLLDRIRAASKRVLLRTTAGLLVLVALGWIAASMGAGLRLAVPLALDRVVPEGWTADVGDVRGSWLDHIRISGLTLDGPDVSLSVEELFLRFRLSPLLDRIVDVPELTIERPTLRVSVADPADEAESLPADTAADGPSALASMLAGERVGAWTVRVGSARLVDGHARLSSGETERYSLSGLRIAAGGGLGAEGLTAVVDTLHADFVSVMPGEAEPFRSIGRVLFAGRLADGRLRLDTLDVTSDRSRVSAGGQVVFTVRPELWDGVDLELVARPLDLRDLPTTLPDAFREHPDLELSVRATGTPDSLLIDVDGSGFGGGTSAGARVVLRADRAAGTHRAETTRREQVDGSVQETGRPADGADGAGPPPSLEATVRFDGLDVSPWSPPSFDGTASGEVELALERLTAGSPFTAEGVVQHEPFTVDTARLVSRPLRGRFEVSGHLPVEPADMADSLASASSAGVGEPGVAQSSATGGAGGLEADMTVTLAVGPTWRSLGDVTARLAGSAADWSVDLGLESARVVGSGAVRWAGSDRQGSVERLRVDALDLSAIDTVYPASDISGALSGRLEDSSGTLRGRFEMALAPSSVAEVSVDTLVLASNVRGRTFEGTLLGRNGLGELETRYTVELADSVVRFDTEQLRYLRPDSVAGAPPIAEAHGRASGSWALSEARRGALHAALDSARWQERTVRDAVVTGRLEGERIVVDVELDALDVAPTPLSVQAHLDATGTTLEGVRGSARLTASRAHADDEGMVDTLRARVEARGGGLFEVDGSVRAAEGGAVAFRGTADASGTGLGFDLTARGGFDQPLAMFNGMTIDSIFVEAAGRRDSTEWRDARADVTVVDARWRDLVAHTLHTSLTYDSTGLRLDTLDVRSNVLEARGSGVLPLDRGGGRIEVTAELLELEPLRVMSGRDVLGAAGGTFEATLTGSLDSLSWTSTLDVRAIVLDRIRMTNLRLTGEGVVAAPYDRLYGISSTALDLTLDRIILPESQIRTVQVSAAGGPDSIRVQADALVDGRRRGSALIHVDPRPDRRVARIEELSFQVDSDRWSLVEEAVLSYGTGVTVEPVLLRAGEQELRIAGGVTEEGMLDLNARVDSLDITTVADLVGFPRLRGWLTGRARVRGVRSAPEAWLDVGGAFHRANRPPGPMEMRIRANGRSVDGDVRLWDSGAGGSVRLTGGALLPGARRATTDGTSTGSVGPDGATAPDTATIFGLASDSIDVTLAADSFNLRWLEAFVAADAIASLGGDLEGSLTLEGSSSEPELGGRLTVRNGSARPTALGVQWEAISATVRGRGPDLVVDSVRVAGSSGELRAEGTVAVAGAMPLDLQVRMDGFRAIRSDAYQAVVSGALDVGGTAVSPDLQGDIRVEALDVFLDERVTSEGLEPVALSEQDLEMLRDRFGIVPDTGGPQRPFSERITADLTVELGRDSWLRKRTSPEMAVPFSGSIEVEMRPGQPPSLQGSVEVIADRGFVEQFGRRFELAEGTVTFNGPPDATRVDLQAAYTIPSRDNPDDAEVTIILEVSGTQDDLSLTLSSEPAMENADIVSYIATGRPAAGSLSFGEGGQGEGGLVAAGADYALGQMTSLIETAAARRVGLDVVEIRREGLRQATLVAGKYVSPRLYVGFAQPVSLQEGDGLSFGSEGRSELEIEYEAFRWLLLNIEGSGSSVRFFLRGRHAY